MKDDNVRVRWGKKIVIQDYMGKNCAVSAQMLQLVSLSVCLLAVAGVSITLLALPGDFTHYLEVVKGLALGPVIIYGMKLVLAFPVTYHFLNGIRHLVSCSPPS